ncbi:MAG: IS5 family transposase [Vampirovibrio sp.]|nr:IS5 family transposase [Vampirovibrio sp.]
MTTFADIQIQQATPTHKFLEEMNQTLPWQLFETILKTHIHHKPNGRPPYKRLLLLKMNLLKIWFNLSYEQTEFQCHDRLSFRKFLGFSLESPIPEATTLENFQHELQNTPAQEALFLALDTFFQENNLILKEGNLVDATFIKANSKQRKKPEDQSDPDATYGYKGFGYSATVNVDAKSKLIRKVVVTGANVHDSQSLLPVLVGYEQTVGADSGYVGKEKDLKALGIQPRIIKRRVRGKQHEPTPELTASQKRFNGLVSKIRARVEHVFAGWKTVFKKVRVSCRGLVRVSAEILGLAFGYNCRRYGFLVRRGVGFSGFLYGF